MVQLQSSPQEFQGLSEELINLIRSAYFTRYKSEDFHIVIKPLACRGVLEHQFESFFKNRALVVQGLWASPFVDSITGAEDISRVQVRFISHLSRLSHLNLTSSFSFTSASHQWYLYQGVVSYRDITSIVHHCLSSSSFHALHSFNQ